MSVEANARRVVPQARARELLDLRSAIIPGARVVEVGDLRKHMTAEEVRAVTLYWQSLPGSASFASALARLARPAGPAPSYLDRGEMYRHEAAAYRAAVRRQACAWSSLPEAVRACVRRDLEA